MVGLCPLFRWLILKFDFLSRSSVLSLLPPRTPDATEWNRCTIPRSVSLSHPESRNRQDLSSRHPGQTLASCKMSTTKLCQDCENKKNYFHLWNKCLGYLTSGVDYFYVGTVRLEYRRLKVWASWLTFCCFIMENKKFLVRLTWFKKILFWHSWSTSFWPPSMAYISIINFSNYITQFFNFLQLRVHARSCSESWCIKLTLC